MPWTSFVGSRGSRDAICSLHLICGATAAMELATEEGLQVSVFLYGGCFCIPVTCIGKQMVDLRAELAALDNSCPNPRQGEVLLTTRQSSIVADERDLPEGISLRDTALMSNREGENELPRRESTASAAGIPQRETGHQGGSESLTNDRVDDSNNVRNPEVGHGVTLLRVPRTRVLKVTGTGGLEITNHTIIHGETETRFVAAFMRFVEPKIQTNECNPNAGSMAVPEIMRYSTGARNSCVIISKDTDVTIILGLAKQLHGWRIIHVLVETIIDIDALLQTVLRNAMQFETIASVYVPAGCDFTPGTYGVSHEHYLKAVLRHKGIIGAITTETCSESLLCWRISRSMAFVTSLIILRRLYWTKDGRDLATM